MSVMKYHFEDSDQHVVIDNLIKGKRDRYVSLGHDRSAVVRSEKIDNSSNMVMLELCKPVVPKRDETKTSVTERFAEDGGDGVGDRKQVTQPLKGDQKVVSPRPDKAEFDKLKQQHMRSLEEDMNQVKEQRLRALEDDVNQIKKQRLADIEKAAQKITKTYQQKGYEEGYAEGKKAVDSDFTEMLTSFREDVVVASNVRQRAVDQSSDAIKDLALGIAEKIVHVNLRDNEEVMQGVFKESLQRITDKDRVVIRINPAEKGAFEHFQKMFKSLFQDIKKLDVVEDDKIKRGGCIIDTRMGFIDSSVATKLSLIKTALQSV